MSTYHKTPGHHRQQTNRLNILTAKSNNKPRLILNPRVRDRLLDNSLVVLAAIVVVESMVVDVELDVELVVVDVVVKVVIDVELVEDVVVDDVVLVVLDVVVEVVVDEDGIDSAVELNRVAMDSPAIGLLDALELVPDDPDAARTADDLDTVRRATGTEHAIRDGHAVVDRVVDVPAEH